MALLDTNADGVTQIEHPLHLLINPQAIVQVPH